MSFLQSLRRRIFLIYVWHMHLIQCDMHTFLQRENMTVLSICKAYDIQYTSNIGCVVIVSSYSYLPLSCVSLSSGNMSAAFGSSSGRLIEAFIRGEWDIYNAICFGS